MHELALIIGLLLATVIAVGLGDKLKLPYPVLMVLIALGAGFIPGIPELHLNPELILPLFLPPLLFATAKKTSWSVFRIRWRSVILLAIGLIVVTVAVVAGAAWLLIPGIGLPAAIALGAMVAPPDPVAVESVAGRVHMPRRLLTVLQSEGLFNDAAAIVIFQTAVAAAVNGRDVDGWLAMTFLVGSTIAVVLGLAMAWVAKKLIGFIDSSTARSAVTLVVPFAVYILAEELHASGVIAVVVTALEMKRRSRPQDAAERITGNAFWDVTELLATGLAFGLIGLVTRSVIEETGAETIPMLGKAAIICAVVVSIRAAWLALLVPFNRRRDDGLPPNGPKDVLLLTWCGMRGLATLALALALPEHIADGTPFPARDQIVLTAVAVLFTTLIIPGSTLPWLMRKLQMREAPAAEHEAERVLAQRAEDAALSALHDAPFVHDLPHQRHEAIERGIKRLSEELITDAAPAGRKGARTRQEHDSAVAIRTIALDAARQEVVNARNEPGTDPEIADRVLHRLDLLTVMRQK
ncbi:Na+/H+ antiporter [Arthrobacter sp. UYCo732]|uniref:Na+/H+ antiporter n=1 Tax=Arthrobacter sp. UYCo732 TaxID=3156336 RepID=UPI00339B3DDE